MKKIRKYYYAGNIVYPGLNTQDRSNNWMDVMAQQVMPTPQISSVQFPPQSWMSPIQKAQANNYIQNLGVTSKNNGISSIPATSSTGDIQDNNIGSALGNIFSQGVSSIGNTAFNNIMKGQFLSDGMAQDAASSVSGAVAGLAGNLVGKGINSLGGNSMLSRGIGQGIATGIGTIGGQALSNIIKGKAAFGGISDSIKAIKGIKNASNFSKATGISNLAGIGGQIVGAGLQAAFGPSKEYGGKYGSITQGMDTAYDLVQSAVGFIPGWGQVASGAMALNKGLSNIFGSTSGMTKQDAILGSAFMPAPVKWLNMAGAKTTQNFGNQSWQNTERTNAFMQNAFGNLSERFDRARQEAGKTYGTFSQGARRSADRNLAFANNAWEQILAMTDQDELQRIRSQYMTSINNQRYAQMIQGGWNPIYRGKQGMKILNNATNHNMGMRLLSAAALIDDKQMILCNVQD